MNKIPVYAINLKKRSDRKINVEAQFFQRTEFDLHIVNAIEHEIGAIGLWNTIKFIIEKLISKKDQYIILCEDDHQFTEFYDRELLFRAILEATNKEADILCGGVSWFSTALQISHNLFWIDQFTGLQFTVIFRKFFKTILEADFGVNDVADYKISNLTANKMVITPFISTQKEFGYSDVTSKNNAEGYVTEIFNGTLEKFEQMKNVALFYDLDVCRL